MCLPGVEKANRLLALQTAFLLIKETFIHKRSYKPSRGSI